MGGKYTESQKRATLKHLKENTDELKIRLPKKGMKQGYRDKVNLITPKISLNQFVIDAIEEKIKRDIG